MYQIDRIIEAIHLLRQRGLDCTLTIAGTGSEQAALESLTERLGLTDKVRFDGWISNDQLPSLLTQHDAYISAINTDGVSASLLEAMAAGLFPIVPDNVANRNWIEPRENGILFAPDVPQAIADAVTQAAADPALRARAAEINRRLVSERGDLRRNTAQYLTRFAQLIDAHQTRTHEKEWR